MTVSDNFARKDEEEGLERNKQQPQITEKARFSINAVNDLSKHTDRIVSACMLGRSISEVIEKERRNYEELCA